MKYRYWFIVFLVVVLVSGGFAGYCQPGAHYTRGVAKTSPAPELYVAEFARFVPPAVRSIGLRPYYDYAEALAAGRRTQPVLVYFTGVNCVNCRRMEERVWTDPEVAQRLRDQFVVASLYCDRRDIKIPENQQRYSKELNQQIVTLADKNIDLQAAYFGSNSQPSYYFVDGSGNLISKAVYNYDPDPRNFVSQLDAMAASFKKLP